MTPENLGANLVRTAATNARRLVEDLRDLAEMDVPGLPPAELARLSRSADDIFRSIAFREGTPS